MSIKLKYKYNYRITSAIIAIFALFFGLSGAIIHIKGLFLIPFTSACLAFLICIEKKKILSVIVSFILMVSEFLIGFRGYYTINSLSSILLAVVISFCFIKGINKSNSVLFGTLIASATLITTVILYSLGTVEGAGISDVFDIYLENVFKFKDKMINYVISMPTNMYSNAEPVSIEYLSEVFDAYIDCTIALVAIFAFTIVGISSKIFSFIVKKCTKDTDMIEGWHFMPTSAFAYFFLVISVFSMFLSVSDDVLDISILNLYLIFLVVFAYVGFKHISSVIKRSGRSHISAFFSVLVILILFSSIAIQILAVCGAIICIKYAKLTAKNNT